MKRTYTLLWISLIFVCGVFIFYSSALTLPLLGDDLAIVQQIYQLDLENRIGQQVLNDFHSTFLDSGGNFYRPFVTLVFALDYHFWQENPFGYHLTNVFLHLTNTLLFYAITLRLLPTSSRKTRLLIGVLATLFFALRPVTSEVVLWVSGRTDSLALLGMLLTVYGYLCAQGQWNRWYGVALLGFMFALGSKESAATLPAALVGLHLFRFVTPLQQADTSTRRERWRAHIQALLPFVLLVGGYFLWRWLLFGSLTYVYEIPRMDFNDPHWVNTKIASFRYFLSPRYAPGWDSTLTNYIMLFILVLGGAAALLSRSVFRLWGMAWLWMMGILIPALPQFFINSVGEGERLLYIPTVPLALIVTAGVLGFSGSTRWQKPGLWVAVMNLVAVLAIMVVTIPWQIQRMNEWQAVGDQLVTMKAEVLKEAGEVPTGQTRILIVPGAIDGIFFARNGQGPLMVFPFQPYSVYGSVFIHASEYPCRPPDILPDFNVYDTKCWNLRTNQFEPFDATQYNPDHYPRFWVLNDEKLRWLQ